ncbi:MAG: C-terminal binding protein [Planctomycetes bacterium]|nr:C-terminal binding protein [Planctomycetota bacterium]
MPMENFKVVLVANDLLPTPEWVARQLEEKGINFVERLCGSDKEVVEAAADAEVVWVLGGSQVVTADILPLLRRCRAILRTGSGTDNIPVREATLRGILVANTPEAVMHAVAEHTIGLLFAVIRQIVSQDRLVRRGIWNLREAWPNWHLVGQTLGLVGFGRIAQLVARKTRGLEMKIVACDPAVEAMKMAEHGVEKADLEDLLRRSDYVSIHVPLLDRTHHLIGERELRLMRPRAVLINTARGKVIDQPALIRALREGWIAAAGLDVFDREPLGPDHPLCHLDNVVLTPHSAGYSDVFHEQFWRDSVKTLLEMARNGWPIWVVNPEVTPWWKSAIRSELVDESSKNASGPLPT